MFDGTVEDNGSTLTLLIQLPKKRSRGYLTVPVEWFRYSRFAASIPSRRFIKKLTDVTSPNSPPTNANNGSVIIAMIATLPADASFGFYTWLYTPSPTANAAPSRKPTTTENSVPTIIPTMSYMVGRVDFGFIDCTYNLPEVDGLTDLAAFGN